jgi:hypothetical protein
MLMVEIYVSFVLGGADVDYPFWAVALGPCFEPVERRPDLRCARGLAGRLVTPRDVDEISLGRVRLPTVWPSAS